MRVDISDLRGLIKEELDKDAIKALTRIGLRQDQHGTWWSDTEGEDGMALEIGDTKRALSWAQASGRLRSK